MNKYNPLLSKYNDLWAKHLKGELSHKGLPWIKVNSQESAIQCSLAVLKFIKAKSKESGVSFSKLIAKFKEGKDMVDSVLLVSKRSQDVDDYGLWFDFDNTENLFLEADRPKKCVFIIE